MSSQDQAVQSYAPGEHPDLPAPMLTSGPLFWIKENLASSWLNIAITVITALLLFAIVPPVLNWVFFDAVYVAADRNECRELGSGACWAFVSERFTFFVYAFYPSGERWRVNLAFILMIVALVPLLYDKTPYRGRALIFSCFYPVIAYWLLLGGFFGLKAVETHAFGGIMLNLVIGVTGIVCSLPAGILLALGRQSEMPVVRMLSVLFIEFFRGVPLITILFVASTMLSYFLPPGSEFDLLLRVLIMVTLFSAAYLAEVIRGGLQAIPKGQFEASDSMGLKYWQSMRLIVLPQALKISIPGIVNSFIGLFKDTTLVLIIGLLDLLGLGKSALADAKWTGLSNEIYLSVAVFFFICCFSMSRYSLYLERKLETGHKR
ncbi:MAG: amino acid ABC transporter permease [Hyphomicrobiales bacterium]|nr:amino acid ABC transporter permease [Hyphomicrobiales bacterium]